MKKQKGFTLIELLVVIAILGILSTLAVVSLQNARSKGRDAKRVSDIRQIQTGLELYFNDNGAYPIEATAVTLGATGQETLSSAGFAAAAVAPTYIGTVPAAPAVGDGSGCSVATDIYSYITDANGTTYAIDYCLGGLTGGVAAGPHTATPNGMVDDLIE